jgi:hypothetical protein
MLFTPRYYLACQLGMYLYHRLPRSSYRSFSPPYTYAQWKEIENQLGIHIPFFSDIEKLFDSLYYLTGIYDWPHAERIWLANRNGWLDNSETFAFLLDCAAMGNHPAVRATAITYAASLLPKDASFNSFLEARQKVEPNKSLCNYIKALADFTACLAAREPKSMARVGLPAQAHERP